MTDEKYRPFWLAGFFISRDWFEEYDLQVYLKGKSEALSDFHLAQLLINFNGSLLKMRLKE
jgi:hypothetical protein